VPAMYYVGLIFNLIFLLLGIFGYLYILRRNGEKYLFIILFVISWLWYALSYVFLISGAYSNEWYITVIRIIGYVFNVAALVSLIVELSRLRKGSLATRI
jgi:hypothetical protein